MPPRVPARARLDADAIRRHAPCCYVIRFTRVMPYTSYADAEFSLRRQRAAIAARRVDCYKMLFCRFDAAAHDVACHAITPPRGACRMIAAVIVCAYVRHIYMIRYLICFLSRACYSVRLLRHASMRRHTRY